MSCRIRDSLFVWLSADGKSLLDYLAARPSTYIDEQVYYLWDTFEVQVSEQSIKRMLKRVKWSKKKVFRIVFFHPIFLDITDI